MAGRWRHCGSPAVARDQPVRQLTRLLADNPGPGIVYAQTRAQVERLAESLGASGRPVLPYHAGLPAEVRGANQAAFVASEDMVMVATIAFGMGIDKPDVRFVAHAGLPKSIEAYYQETGRAGRDGDPALAVMLWGADDFARARQRLSEVEPQRLPGERQRLDALATLVETAGCRRAILLRHFGEDPPQTCGNCDNCIEAPGVVDASETARKLLFVNVAHTSHFVGMTAEESAPILEFLFAHQVKPEFTCRFRWQVNSLAFWDNRAAQHNPVNDYHGFRRRMRRITLAGEVPR